MTDEATIDPATGAVLGLRWGADEDACAAGWGASGRDASDRGPITLAGVRWAPELTFELDALCAITLRAEDGPAVYDGPALPRLLDLVERWLGEAPRRTDEGYWQAEDLTTRVTLDLVDGAIVFEDVDL